MPMDKQTFCERLVYLDRRLISFQDRPYLSDIYASDKRNLVLRCSRQTEKSTFLANSILYEACTNPGISMLLVTPREQQSITFCRARLLPCLARSPLLQRELLGAKAREKIGLILVRVGRAQEGGLALTKAVEELAGLVEGFAEMGHGCGGWRSVNGQHPGAANRKAR